MPYLGEKISPIMIFTRVKSPPAPHPCTPLPTNSIAIDVAAPQSAHPSRKISEAVKRTTLRPQISLNFPQFGVDAAEANMKTEPIQVYADAD